MNVAELTVRRLKDIGRQFADENVEDLLSTLDRLERTLAFVLVESDSTTRDELLAEMRDAMRTLGEAFEERTDKFRARAFVETIHGVFALVGEVVNR